jgi:poly(beta-D-mannuronate) lyase
MILHFGSACLLMVMPFAALAECPLPPEPVVTLSFESRYEEGDESRSDIDLVAEEEAEAAIAPVDDFLRELVRDANAVVRGDENADADCVLSRILSWAEGDALAELGSDTARLTIGARIAGFALVMRQVKSGVSDPDAVERVEDWLTGLIAAQMEFWDTDAPPRARNGNLRAWAALGGAAVAGLTDDETVRDWSAVSVTHVLCTVAPDGSIPQEMTRGHLALGYQLHAIAPLVLSAVLLDEQGNPVHLACDGALGRSVLFTAMDIHSGTATKTITGEVQSFFDGSDTIEDFHLAWIEAYLRLPDMPGQAELDRLAEERRPLSYSKLGGNQTLLWND